MSNIHCQTAGGPLKLSYLFSDAKSLISKVFAFVEVCICEYWEVPNKLDSCRKKRWGFIENLISLIDIFEH